MPVSGPRPTRETSRVTSSIGKPASALIARRLVPAPGIGDHAVERAVRGRPAQFADRAVAAADQPRRIAGAPWAIGDRNRPVADTAGGGNNLAHREPAPAAEAEKAVVAAPDQPLKTEDM